jgi:hypothetical protein
VLFWCAIQLSVCNKCWAEVTPSCRGDPYYNEPRNGRSGTVTTSRISWAWWAWCVSVAFKSCLGNYEAAYSYLNATNGSTCMALAPAGSRQTKQCCTKAPYRAEGNRISRSN